MGIILIESGAFDQEAIDAMYKALEFASIGRPDVHETILASKVIMAAKAGERDPALLCAAVLGGLKPRLLS